MVNDIAIDIIVCARNEESHIANCIEAILAQEYPEQLVSVYFVNDHSTDSTLEILQSIVDSRLSIIDLPPGTEGKKAGIKFAIGQSQSPLIIQTDADCVMSPGWIKNWVNLFSDQKIHLGAGLVYSENSDGSWLSTFQDLDFRATMVLQHFALNKAKIPLGNAANMAFGRKAYQKIKNDIRKEELRSGDDIFLLEAFLAADPAQVLFHSDPEFAVTTQAASSWAKLFSQRTRWAEKTSHYKGSKLKSVLGLIGFSYSIVLVGILGMFFQPGLILPVSVLLIFLSLCNHWWFQKIAGRTACIESFLFTCTHVVFTLAIGLFSLAGAKKPWKGRKY